MTTKLDFIYDYDLDSNGLFGYLVRQSALGNNPAYPGPGQTLKMFASSIASGFPESLVCAHEKSDFMTMNQAYSYIGFELLGGRRLVPSCYTIRNCLSDGRNERSGECSITLLNWQFEASHDMVNWVILDKRIHFPETRMQRGPPSQEVQQMVVKGQVTTYGILGSSISQIDRLNGFKYFRLV